jgi:hypothetical protein
MYSSVANSTCSGVFHGPWRWHAPGLREALFLGGSYLQGRENIADVQTIEVLAGVP